MSNLQIPGSMQQSALALGQPCQTGEEEIEDLSGFVGIQT
jgi:hypothetical protein